MYVVLLDAPPRPGELVRPKPYALVVERTELVCNPENGNPYESIAAEIERYTSPTMARRGLKRWQDELLAKGFVCKPSTDDFTLKLEYSDPARAEEPIYLRALIVAREASAHA